MAGRPKDRLTDEVAEAAGPQRPAVRRIGRKPDPVRQSSILRKLAGHMGPESALLYEDVVAHGVSQREILGLAVALLHKLQQDGLDEPGQGASKDVHKLAQGYLETIRKLADEGDGEDLPSVLRIVVEAAGDRRSSSGHDLEVA